MTRSYQNGSLVQKKYKGGKAWVLRHRYERVTDGKWVEGTPIFIGWVKDFPTKAEARAQLKLLNVNLNLPRESLGVHPVTIGRLTRHYIQHELPEDQLDATIPKAYSTRRTYIRYLNKWIVPRWENCVAASVQPLGVEDWLKGLRRKERLSNGTCDKIRRILNLLYKHGQRHGLLSRGEEGNPMRLVRQSTLSNFNPVVLTLAQAFGILNCLDLMKRTLVLVIAATALRISEILALQWSDLDFERQCIYVRRAYVYGRFGPPKSKASKAPVPLHPVLAAHLVNWRRETPYAGGEDLIFPSMRLRGRKPPAANMLVSGHLRKAAEKVGVAAPPRAFGFHAFRRTLASVLIANNYDPKLVQELLRHSNIKTTLDLYAKAVTPAKVGAQGWFLQNLLEQEKLASPLVQ